MATIQNVIDEVTAILGRPDQATLITSTTKAMIIKAHCVEKFHRDLWTTTGTAVTTPGQIVTENLPTRFRDFESIMVTDSSGSPVYSGWTGGDRSLALNVDYIQFVDPNEFPNNVKYTVVGDKYKVASPFGSISNLSLGYYAFPDLTNLANTTWMLGNELIVRAIEDGISMYVKLKLRDPSAKVDANMWTMWQEDIRALGLLV